MQIFIFGEIVFCLMIKKQVFFMINYVIGQGYVSPEKWLLVFFCQRMLPGPSKCRKE